MTIIGWLPRYADSWVFKTYLTPDLSDSEPVWLRIYLLSNLSVPSLSDSESIWFRTYLFRARLIPNLSDSKPIWFWTYVVPNRSHSEPIWYGTHHISNLSDTDLSIPNLRPDWVGWPLCVPPVSPSASILRWQPNPSNTSCGKIGDQTGQPQSPLPLPAHDD
jgi:hypothetical protein